MNTVISVFLAFTVNAAAVDPAAPQSAAAAGSVTMTQVHPLVFGLDLDVSTLGQQDAGRLFEAGDWLASWSLMADRAPVEGTSADFLAAKRKAKAIFAHLRGRQPGDAAILAQLAGVNYGIGELLPEDAKDERMALYEEMVEVAEYCVEQVDPDDAQCLHEWAVGIGRAATTRGVLASLFSAKDVEKTWLRALDLQPADRSLAGDPLINDIRYGLGVYYRIVPDNWLVRLLAGTRGDKSKSVKYFSDAAADTPNRLELQKELAVALLCYGDDEDDDASIQKGRSILEQIIAGEFDKTDLRATDEIDKVHAQVLLDSKPSRACGYSRDGFQDVSDESVEKLKAE